jgi:hypothetical protein
VDGDAGTMVGGRVIQLDRVSKQVGRCCRREKGRRGRRRRGEGSHPASAARGARMGAPRPRHVHVVKHCPPTARAARRRRSGCTGRRGGGRRHVHVHGQRRRDRVGRAGGKKAVVAGALAVASPNGDGRRCRRERTRPPAGPTRPAATQLVSHLHHPRRTTWRTPTCSPDGFPRSSAAAVQCTHGR